MSIEQKWLNVSSLRQGIEMVVNEPKLVLLAAKEPLDAAIATNCQVMTVTAEEGLLPVWLSIAFQKGSPYTDLFSDA